MNTGFSSGFDFKVLEPLEVCNQESGVRCRGCMRIGYLNDCMKTAFLKFHFQESFLSANISMSECGQCTMIYKLLLNEWRCWILRESAESASTILRD